MSGKVMPSSIDCGRISRQAASHLTVMPSAGAPIDGSIVAWKASIRPLNTLWNSSAITPTMASTSA